MLFKKYCQLKNQALKDNISNVFYCSFLGVCFIM